ncbi:alpha/beta hydrolase [Kitasatospora sp. NPDC093806]|uniref:alpha/beta fold hydrolase n=1 Tax=Kitasatospora sp. NPDC093806 TaxID=3155075 RepID=UPI0034493EC7
MEHNDFDIDLPSGRVRVRRWGQEDRPVVFGVSGLTANLSCFEILAERLVAAGFQLLAHDMRGRGVSDNTAPGTYGWPAHARDIVGIADALGIARFDYIGWSTGSLIGLHIHKSDPERLRRLVLLDQVAAAPDDVLDVARQVIDRLDATVPSLPGYIEQVAGMGLIRPWDEMWARYLEYEMEPVEGGWRSRTSKAAVLEDFEWDLHHDGRDLWEDVTCPVLLVRGMEALTPTSGLIVPEETYQDFLKAVPATEVVEVDRSHYGVGISEVTGSAVVEFLSRP